METKHRYILIVGVAILFLFGSYREIGSWSPKSQDSNYMTAEEIENLIEQRILASAVSLPSGIGGVTDHDALTGLNDDDHLLYLLQDGSETSGIDANWIQLGGENKTIWPIGGSGVALDNYPFEYLVFSNSTGAYAINGSTGLIEFSGSDHDFIINSAFDGLTSGRTWKERVICIGSFTIDNSLVVIDYTVLEVYGYFYLADGSDVPMITNADYAGGNTDIEIIGGTWWGNKEGQTPATGTAMSFVNVTRGLIDGVSVYNASRDAISFVEGKDSKMINCYIEDWYWYGYVLGGSSDAHKTIDCAIINCISVNGDLYDAYLVNFADNNTLLNDKAYNAPNQNYHIYRNSSNNRVIGCYGFGGLTDSILIGHSTYPTDYCNYNLVSTFTATGCAGGAFGIAVGFHNRIENSISIGCGTGTAIGQYAHDNIVSITVLDSTGSARDAMISGDRNTVTLFTTKDGNGIGIEVRGDDNHITGGWYSGYSTAIFLYPGCDGNIVDNNVISAGNTGLNVATTGETRVGVNHFLAITSGALDDTSGGASSLQEVQLDLVNATEWISTAPFGGKIDAATEYVIGLGKIPDMFERVYFISVYGIALDTDADNMTLEIEGYAWTDNEPYTTETITIAILNSTTTNFGANEGICWRATSTMDADIKHILGGDWIMIKVIYADASGSSIASNCLITAIILEGV